MWVNSMYMVPACGDRRRVGSMPVGISRRAQLIRLVHLPIGRLVTGAKVLGADQFAVAREITAMPLPLRGDRPQVLVIEALSLRPYPRINYSDYKIRPEVRLLQQARDAVASFQTQELG